MSQAPVSNPPSPEQIAPAPKRGLLGELQPFWISFLSPFFYISLFVGLLLMLLAYQLPYTKTVSVNTVGDRAYLFNYYAREEYQGFVYRWMQPNSAVKLPGVGQPPITRVRMELSPRPPDAPPTTVNYFVNGEGFKTFELDQTQRKFYDAEYYPSRRPFFDFARGDLDFYTRLDPPYIAKGDKRPFGAVVSAIEIRGSGILETGRPTIPPWGTVLLLLASLVGLNFAARRTGFGARGAAAIVLATAALLATGIAFDRALIGLTAPLLLVAVVAAYIFLATGLIFVKWWMGRRGLLLSQQQARWLGLIFLLAFIVRGVGINHPTFQVLDHGFRVHEAMKLRENPGGVLLSYYNVNTGGSVSGDGKERSVTLGQWGLSVAIPYPPMFYILNLPLAQLLYTDEKTLVYWTNIFALWWETTALFLLYIIARQSFGKLGDRGGLIAAGLAAFFPLSFLMPSDGGYPTMLAQWLTLFFFMIVTGWFWQRRHERLPLGWKSIIGGGVALGLAMLAHTATMLLLGFFMLLLIASLYIWGGRYKYLTRPVFLTELVGGVVSFGLYYGFYVLPLLTNTLPAVAGKVGQGQNVGDDDRTLKGFFPEITAHFHFFPVIIAFGVLVYLLFLSWRGAKKKLPLNDESFGVNVLSEIPRPIILFLAAWAGTFVVFSLASLRLNLLHKHMLFALPLFALLCGLAGALLVEYLRHKPTPNLVLRIAQSVIVGGVVYFIAVGCYIWFVRVIHYVLPAGTG